MANLRLKRAVLEVVDNQLDANDPPFIRDIFEHLSALTYSDEEAKELIGSVVASELYDITAAGKSFDVEKYHEKLLDLFNRFDPEDVEVYAQIAAHPFCRMQKEYDDYVNRGDEKNAAAAFVFHWHHGLRDWLRAFARKPDGSKKPFSSEYLDEEDRLIGGDEIGFFFSEIDLTLYNAGFHKERLLFSRDMQEFFLWDGLEDEWGMFREIEGDSLNQIGDYEGCDKLYENWLEQSPGNIRCLNGYLLCLLSRGRDALNRAKELIDEYMPPETKVDPENDLLVERAIELYEALDDMDMVRIYTNMRDRYYASKTGSTAGYDFEELFHAPYIAKVKVRPNDPCPCGSGKKYKKCCGKAV